MCKQTTTLSKRYLTKQISKITLAMALAVYTRSSDPSLNPLIFSSPWEGAKQIYCTSQCSALEHSATVPFLFEVPYLSSIIKS